MRIVIAGGTGLIGRAFTRAFAADGHEVVILTRSASRPASGETRYINWTPDGTAAGAWVNTLDGAGAVINLTGAGMADRRWTPARKAELRASRILPTESLVAAVRAVARRPATFIQNSAVGYYGTDDGTKDVGESAPAGRDFLGQLCVAWEAAALPAVDLGCRLVTLRTGVVLAADGGIIARLRLPFLLFAGGPIASGRQYLPWIHVADLVAMTQWALATPDVRGPLNATSPTPVTNARFVRALARALHRPCLLPIPAFALRLVFGEMAQAMLIEGQRVVPAYALARGFSFAYTDIDGAMAAALAAP